MSQKDKPRGRTSARIFTPPKTELSPETSWGYECCDFLERVCGWDLLPWQRWLYIHALEKDDTGKEFRFSTIIILIARQNGKTKWLEGLALWRLFLDGAKMVISTAQNLDYAERNLAEGYESLAAVPALRREVKDFKKTNGKHAICLSGGREWCAKSVTRRAGRSLSADLAILDELREHQSWDAWSAIVPTTIAVPRSLVVATSNAGDKTSVVLKSLRDSCRSEIIGGNCADTKTALFEWSVAEDRDPLDESAWGDANPSLGYLIDVDKLRSFSKLEIDVFKTEHLCQWVEVVESSIFPSGSWESCGDPNTEPAPGADIHIGIDVSFNRTYTYIAAAYERRDGRIGVEVVARRPGTGWVVDWLKDEKRDWFNGRIALQTRGAPVASLVDTLSNADIDIAEWQGAELAKGCSQFFDAVVQGELRHLSQPVLEAAASVAKVKPIGDSWVWDRKNSDVDIAPLCAATAALWLAKKPAPEKFVSAYEDGGLLWV